MSGDRLHRAADCVLAVEAALREAGFWDQTVPTPAAMASRAPFCADTLEFSQWLRFVFVPRMHALIEAGGPLPATSGIAVMAETRLDAETPAERRLIAALAEFDALIQS